MKRHGFTLIELLVVIAIIALLASIMFAALGTAKAKARDANRIATARSLTQALALYEDKNGSVININSIPGGSGFSMGAISATTSTSVISVLVSGGYLSRQVAGDSLYGVDEYYLAIAADGRYQVYAKLERPENSMSSSTLTSLTGGTGALNGGYNYGFGGGSGVGSGGGGVVATGGGSPSAASLTLTASPSTVTGGQSFVLSWSSTNASSTCTASDGWSGSKSNNGSTTISSIAAPTSYTLYCANASAGGTGATSTASVAYTGPVGPTAFNITQTANNRIFTVAWTAGSGNGGSGGCRLQYQSDSSWVNVASPTTVNCDTSTSSLSVQLPSGSLTGVAGNWNNRKLRIQRVSDSVGVSTSTNALACTSKAGSGSPTPNVDEDCDATWDNVVSTADNCNTCSVTQWSYDYTETDYNATSCGGGVYGASGSNIGGFNDSTSCNSDRSSRFTGACYNTGGAGPYYSYRYTTASCTSSSNSVTDCGICGGTYGSTTYY